MKPLKALLEQKTQECRQLHDEVARLRLQVDVVTRERNVLATQLTEMNLVVTNLQAVVADSSHRHETSTPASANVAALAASSTPSGLPEARRRLQSLGKGSPATALSCPSSVPACSPAVASSDRPSTRHHQSPSASVLSAPLSAIPPRSRKGSAKSQLSSKSNTLLRQLDACWRDVPGEHSQAGASNSSRPSSTVASPTAHPKSLNRDSSCSSSGSLTAPHPQTASLGDNSTVNASKPIPPVLLNGHSPVSDDTELQKENAKLAGEATAEGREERECGEEEEEPIVRSFFSDLSSNVASRQASGASNSLRASSTTSMGSLNTLNTSMQFIEDYFDCESVVGTRLDKAKLHATVSLALAAPTNTPASLRSSRSSSTSSASPSITPSFSSITNPCTTTTNSTAGTGAVSTTTSTSTSTSTTTTSTSTTSVVGVSPSSSASTPTSTATSGTGEVKEGSLTAADTESLVSARSWINRRVPSLLSLNSYDTSGDSLHLNTSHSVPSSPDVTRSNSATRSTSDLSISSLSATTATTTSAAASTTAAATEQSFGVNSPDSLRIRRQSTPRWLLRHWLTAQQSHTLVDGKTVSTNAPSPLTDLLLCDNMTVLRELAMLVPASDLDDLAKCCMRVFESCNCAATFMVMCIELMADSPSTTESTLFRSNSLASKVLSVYCRMIGVDYLQQTLGPCIAHIASVGRVEIDPHRVTASDCLDTNIAELTSICQSVFDRILASLDELPHAFRMVCHCVRTIVDRRFPDHGLVAVSAFIFLRYLCPALVTPEKFQFCAASPSSDERRTLLLVGKAMQNLSNGSTFGDKEPYMRPLNAFLEANRSAMRAFLDTISTLPEPYIETPLVLPKFMIDDALSRIHVLLGLHIEDLARRLAGHIVTESLVYRTRDDLLALLRGATHFNLTDLTHQHDLLNSLEDLLLSDDLVLAKALLRSASISEHDHLIDFVLRLLLSQGLAEDLISSLVQDQLTRAPEQLCSETVVSKLITAYAFKKCEGFLKSTFSALVHEVLASDASFEYDEARAGADDDLEANEQVLVTTASKFLSSAFASLVHLPTQFRELCVRLSALIDAHTSSTPGPCFIAQLLFSRVFSPAIASPSRHHISDDIPDLRSHRGLAIISSMFCHVACNTAFDGGSQVRHINECIDAHRTPLRSAINSFLTESSVAETSSGLSGASAPTAVRFYHSAIGSATSGVLRPQRWHLDSHQRADILAQLFGYLQSLTDAVVAHLKGAQRNETVTYHLFDRLSLVLAMARRKSCRIVYLNEPVGAEAASPNLPRRQ